MDHLATPDNEKGTKLRKHKEILSSDFGKIKYIKKYYSFLNENDIAYLVDSSSFLIANLFDYPIPTYLKASIDDSIKDKVIRYCERRYPGRIPSDVVTIPFNELTDTNTARRRIAKREYRNRKSEIEDIKESKWS